MDKNARCANPSGDSENSLASNSWMEAEPSSLLGWPTSRGWRRQRPLAGRPHRALAPRPARLARASHAHLGREHRAGLTWPATRRCAHGCQPRPPPSGLFPRAKPARSPLGRLAACRPPHCRRALPRGGAGAAAAASLEFLGRDRGFPESAAAAAAWSAKRRGEARRESALLAGQAGWGRRRRRRRWPRRRGCPKRLDAQGRPAREARRRSWGWMDGWRDGWMKDARLGTREQAGAGGASPKTEPPIQKLLCSPEEGLAQDDPAGFVPKSVSWFLKPGAFTRRHQTGSPCHNRVYLRLADLTGLTLCGKTHHSQLWSPGLSSWVDFNAPEFPSQRG